MARNGNAPVFKARIGYVTATVWQNDDFWNVTVAKSYKDQSGDWKETNSFGHGDLMNVVQAVKRAEDFIASQQQ